MAYRAAPVMLAALAAGRTLRSVRADSSRNDTPSNAANGDDAPFAHAIALMERYHKMSLEAMQANSGQVPSPTNARVPASGQETPGLSTSPMRNSVSIGFESSAFGEKCEHAEEAYPSTAQGLTSDPNAIRSQTSTALALGGTEKASSSYDVPDATPSLPQATKRQKAPRIAPSKMFKDLEAKGDVCVTNVIVGGGTAAWAAVQAIRRRDPAADILIVTEERFFPYNRTPLSKELWARDTAGLFTSEVGTKMAVEYTYTQHEEGSDVYPVAILRGTPVVSLDVDEKTVKFPDGLRVEYKNLLLATGGRPRRPREVCHAFEADARVEPSVSTFRTIDDFRELRSKLGPSGSSVAVVGGGFLGTELAVAMAGEGRTVSLLCAEPGVLYKVLPRYLSQFLSHRFRNEGIQVLESVVVADARCVSEEDERVALSVSSGSDDFTLYPVDKIVVATGIEPRVELAKQAGLEIDARNGGIVVNEQMNAEANVWVAGDVASFWDRVLGRRRIEHWDHAVVSGKIAGDRMAGGESRYGLQSMFWSDLANVGVSFQAVGCVESSLDTAASWNLDDEGFEFASSLNKYSQGVVWYLRDNVVVGAVLWNLDGRTYLAAARKAIASRHKLSTNEDVSALLPLPHSEYKSDVRTDGYSKPHDS